MVFANTESLPPGAVASYSFAIFTDRRDASRLQQISSRAAGSIVSGAGCVFSPRRVAQTAHSHPMQQDACVLACQGPSFSLPLSPSVMVMLVMPFRKTSHFRCVIFLGWDRRLDRLLVQGFMSKRQFRHKSVDCVPILHESRAEGSKCGQQLGPFSCSPL